MSFYPDSQREFLPTRDTYSHPITIETVGEVDSRTIEASRRLIKKTCEALGYDGPPPPTTISSLQNSGEGSIYMKSNPTSEQPTPTSIEVGTKPTELLFPFSLYSKKIPLYLVPALTASHETSHWIHLQRGHNFSSNVVFEPVPDSADKKFKEQPLSILKYVFDPEELSAVDNSAQALKEEFGIDISFELKLARFFSAYVAFVGTMAEKAHPYLLKFPPTRLAEEAILKMIGD